MTVHPVLVIGAGPAGLEAAAGLANLGYSCILVEQDKVLGGNPIQNSYAALTPDMRSATEAMQEMIDPVVASTLVDVRMNTTLVSTEGDTPELKATLKGPDGEEVITVSAVIVCTGFTHFDPGRETQMYGYYEYDDVITLVDVERMISAGEFVRPSTGEKPKRVCFIQCVGSRDRQIGNQWCSKVCCGIACKQSIELREMLPDCHVFIFYIDLRAYGFWEDELYWRAQEKHKVSFIRGVVTEVTKRGDTVVIKGEDTTMRRPVEVAMDVVVLSVGMEPSDGTREMAQLLDLPTEDHGFIETVGGALNTTRTSRPGFFVAGAATGPADLEDSVSSGAAAVVKAIGYIRKTQSACAG